MPTVPVYRTHETYQAAPTKSIAGLQQNTTLQQAAKLVPEVVDAAGRMQELHDATNITNADMAGSNWVNDNIYNPEGGALTLQGGNAVGMTQKFMAAYDNNTQSTMQNMSNQAQRQAFSKLAKARRNDLYQTLAGHELQQQKIYQQQTASAHQDASVNAMSGAAPVYLSNPSAFDNVRQLNLQLGANSIIATGRLQGQSDTEISDNVAAFKSKANVAVVDRLLSDGNYVAAKNYYDQYGDSIQGDQKGHVEESIRVGMVRATSDDAARDLLNKHGYAGAMQATENIDDPEMRSAVRANLHQMHADQQADAAEAERQTNEQVLDYAEAGKTVPPQLWASLKPSQRAAYKSAMEPQQNWGAWTELSQMKPSDLAQVSPLDFRGKLDNDHYDKLLGKIDDAKKALSGSAQSAAGLASDSQFMQSFNTAVAKSGAINGYSYGITVSDLGKHDGDAANKYGQLLQVTQSDVEEQEQKLGRKLSPTEMQKIISRNVLDTVNVDSGHWWDSDAKTVAPGLLDGDQRKNAYVPLSKVPQDIKDAKIPEAIRRMAASNGVNLTDHQLEQALGAYLSRDDARFKSIIGSGK